MIGALASFAYTIYRAQKIIFTGQIFILGTE